LLRRQVREHDPDQEADHGRDAQRLEAGVIDIGRDFAPRPGLGTAQEAAQVLDHDPDQADEAAQVLEEVQDAGAEHDHPVEGAGAVARQLDVAGFLDTAEQVFLARVELEALGALLVPGIPEHLGADVVDAVDFGQVPFELAAFLQGRQAAVDALQLAAGGEGVHLPDAARHDRLPRAGGGFLDS